MGPSPFGQKAFGPRHFGFRLKKRTVFFFLKKSRARVPSPPSNELFFQRSPERPSGYPANDTTVESGSRRPRPESVPTGDGERASSGAVASGRCRKDLACQFPNAQETSLTVLELLRESGPHEQTPGQAALFFSAANGRRGRRIPAPTFFRRAPPGPKPRAPFEWDRTILQKNRRREVASKDSEALLFPNLAEPANQILGGCEFP
jgi:hypothetical protein